MSAGNRLLTASWILLVVIAASADGFGQKPEPVQIAANTAPPAVSTPAAEIAPSTSALQARIEAQQQEINKLTLLVEKLQAMLEPVASTHGVLPGSSIGFLPYPSPSPSPSEPPASEGFSVPRELLPDIGQIGAQLGFFVGGATNPYKDDKGFASGGYIDLPWKNAPGGKLSYEIMIGLQRATTKNLTSTSGVNALVNTAVWNYLYNATEGEVFPANLADYLGLGAPGTSPLPTTTSVEERSKVLTVAPFELKYTITKLGRFRPYAVGGLGAYVWIGSDNNTPYFNATTAMNNFLSGLGNTAICGTAGCPAIGAVLNQILQGPQIGGLVPTAPDLAARGVPHGQGNVLFGGQVGGGADIRVTPRLSMGFDFRRNQVEGKNASFNTFAFKQGLNW